MSRSVFSDSFGKGWAEVSLAIGVVTIVALLVIPLPPFLLDLLLALSLTSSVVILLISVYIKDPLDLASFPTILLLLTLFRLGLNVSSTRLILSDGYAGVIIHAFGDFVVRGNYVLGLILLAIITIVNFVVITKGAGRVAEVAARFMLDAMPGKQMAIDADLGAGLIDEAEATRRRQEIARQADFYGAMDGASKFVKGDAIAGLLITLINLIAGFVIGVVQRGMSWGDAISTYTVLTVGDGLVSQIPALLVSTTAGIVVTQTTKGTTLGSAVLGQITQQSKPFLIASGVLGAFALIPGLPAWPFIAMSGATLLMGRLTGSMAEARAKEGERRELKAKSSDAKQASSSPQDEITEVMRIDPLMIEVGLGLASLVDRDKGGELLDTITATRKQAGMELGTLIPAVRVVASINLDPTLYVIKLRGIEVARGTILPRRFLAINDGQVIEKVDGIETTDPACGFPAVWIAPEQKIQAEANGYMVVGPETVIATHLLEVIRQNAADLLGRQEVQNILDALEKTHPALIKDVTNKVSLGVIHRVLQRLLREGIPIRDLVTILETVSDAADQTKDVKLLAEQVRRALANVIGAIFDNGEGAVYGIKIGSRLEEALIQHFSARNGATMRSPLLDPQNLDRVLRNIEAIVVKHRRDGKLPPVITTPALRLGVRELIDPVFPHLPVVSTAELPTRMMIHWVATWDLESPSAPPAVNPAM